MLNPFSISLTVRPSKIYSGLCLNEGSSPAHPAPLTTGEKTNSCPADTRLTIPFPSRWDVQPFLAVTPHRPRSPADTSGPCCGAGDARLPNTRCLDTRWSPPAVPAAGASLGCSFRRQARPWDALSGEGCIPGMLF